LGYDYAHNLGLTKMGNNTTKEEEDDKSAITLDNDVIQLENDKSRFNARLQNINPQIEIIDQISRTDCNVFVLSIESMNHIEPINNLLTQTMSGEILPLQFSIVKIQHEMSVADWPRKINRTTLGIRRLALKKMGKVIFLRGLFKVIVVVIATYISFLLWSINR